MLTVIFGAGASFDSFPDIPAVDQVRDTNFQDSRPPLAKDLFSLRFQDVGRRHPIALPLFSQLRRAENVEHELEIIAGDSFDPEIPRQLFAIRNYLRDVISEAQGKWMNEIRDHSTYLEFLNIIRRWRVKTGEKVSLITFNYDTILDAACTATLGINFKNISSYVSNQTGFQLFRPHGSIGWERVVEGVGTGGNIFDAADHLTWTDEWVVPGEGRRDTLYAPAIAVPTETKTLFELPIYHKEQMEAAISETTMLLVVGWRGAEKHFLKLWEDHAPKEKLQKIEIVNSDPSKVSEVSQRLMRDGKVICGNIHSFSGGFSNYVPEHLSSFLG